MQKMAKQIKGAEPKMDVKPRNSLNLNIEALVSNALKNSGYVAKAPHKQGLLHTILEQVKDFILPKEKISLKLLFDNVRNYLMCAAVVAVAAASAKDQTNTSTWPLELFASFLIIANILQTWFIIERITSGIGQYHDRIRLQWGKSRRFLVKLFLVILTIFAFIAAIRGFSALLAWAIRGGK
jgi:hypothetical protein